LVLRDDKGGCRARLGFFVSPVARLQGGSDCDFNRVSFSLSDPSGNERVRINVDKDSSWIDLLDKDDKPRVSLSVTGDQPLVSLLDKEQKSCVRVLMLDGNPCLTFCDKQGLCNMLLGTTREVKDDSGAVIFEERKSPTMRVFDNKTLIHEFPR
jgi:hypothetical protein